MLRIASILLFFLLILALVPGDSCRDACPELFEEKGRCEGRLLSMLEQSENKTTDAEMAAPSSRREDSRPSSTETQRNQNSGRFFPQGPCSDSPIKSFTSISEAKDCLVDFKKQLVIKPRTWKQTKASRRNQKKC